MKPEHTKYLALALLIGVVAIAILPRNPVVRVIDVEVAGPKVTATLVNDGVGIDVRYWVVKLGRDGRLCEGTITMPANATTAVSFDCPDAGDDPSQFTVETGPAAIRPVPFPARIARCACSAPGIRRPGRSSASW